MSTQLIHFQPRGPFVTDLPNPPGCSVLEPSDPGYPVFELLSELRSPLTLRELMLEPVRKGYIGKPGQPPPRNMPPPASELFPSVQVSEMAVCCSDGLIHCRIDRLKDQTPRGAVVYLHGGGFTVGSSVDTAAITARLAQDTGFLVISVDYRMAPEWPFPFAVDDAFSVYEAVRSEAAALGVAGSAVVVAGDSAGGNLAAALPLMARDRGVRMPDAAVLLCPITNFHAEDHPEFEKLAPRGIVYDAAFFGFIRGAYLTKKTLWSHPYASPVLGELSDYPPTLIVAGGNDPIVGDNRAFHAALTARGVHAEIFEQPGMPHGYYFFPGLLPQGDQAFQAIAAFLRRCNLS